MPPPPLDRTAFATHQQSLLATEHTAELAQTSLLTTSLAPKTLQSAGLALLNLCILNARTGFGGKTLLELGLDSAIGEGDLPEHGLRVGDICAVAEQPKGGERKGEKREKEESRVTGVITKVRKGEVCVALDKEESDVPGGRVWLLKLSNSATHKRLTLAMTQLGTLTPQRTTPLIQVLLAQTSPTPIPASALSPANTQSWPPSLLASLNPSQQSAIQHGLASREISLIHGPPGTGKTHTLIALIQLLLQQDQRILVCGPSNLSVDNLVERLGSAQKAPGAVKTPFLRLGHPARLLPAVLEHSLDVLSRHSSAAEILSSVRSELDAKTASISKTRSGRERRAIYGELKVLRAEFRERERRVVGDLLKEARVVFATLHGAGGKLLRDEAFDVLIVDEAAQALEAQCWIPVLLSGKGVGKLVLAGDHLQLGPTIMSKTSGKTKEKKQKKEAGVAIENAVQALKLDDGANFADSTLETTLFSRLLALYGTPIKTLLDVQYRMHASICAFPSTTLYEAKLVPHPSVAARLLTDLPYEVPVQETEDTLPPLVFYDTQGGLFPEAVEDPEDSAPSGKGRSVLAESKSNADEAALVALHVRRLVVAGVAEEDIGVITPYNAQLAVLGGLVREQFPGVELGSVDGFQGREKEVIVLSLVRSNEGGEVGFLGDERRLNVAMTRAKRQLCVVGDSETVGRGSTFLKSWMEFLEEHADLRYPDLATLQDA